MLRTKQWIFVVRQGISLAGLFAKNLLDASLGGLRDFTAVLLLLALGLLLGVALVIILRVLWPSGRLVFGNNDVTNEPASMTKAEEVHAVLFVSI